MPTGEQDARAAVDAGAAAAAAIVHATLGGATGAVLATVDGPAQPPTAADRFLLAAGWQLVSLAAVPTSGPRPAVLVLRRDGSDEATLEDAARRARYRPRLLVGEHLVLVAEEAEPLLLVVPDPGETTQLAAAVSHWRTLALDGWADAAEHALTARVQGDDRAVAALERELASMRATVSWRVTRPLRAMRRLGRGRP